MFIGCSPSSVGGGIRTTSNHRFVSIFLPQSEDNINIFGRRIDQDDVRKSVVVFMLSWYVFLLYRFYLLQKNKR